MQSFLCKFGAWAYAVKIKAIVVRGQKWLQKAWAMSDILHNFHYNYGFGDVVADVGSIIMPIM